MRTANAAVVISRQRFIADTLVCMTLWVWLPGDFGVLFPDPLVLGTSGVLLLSPFVLVSVESPGVFGT